MLNLEPIKARLAAATPGPWEFCTFKTYPDEYPDDPDAKKENWIQISADAYPREDYKWTLGWCTHYDHKQLDSPGFFDADLITNAPTDIDSLIKEVERLREQVEHNKATMLPILEQVARLKREREVDQAQIRAYERALTWYALPENWVEQVDDRGREDLRWRWADDDGHMARHALNTWRQSAGAKKVEGKQA